MGLSSDPDARACAVCGRVLEQMIDRSSPAPKEYIHSIAGDPDEIDHLPVPVPYDEIPEQLRPRCDFCHQEFPSHTLVAVPLSMPNTDDKVQWDSEWATCDECAELINADRWPLLARRALDSYRARYGEPHHEVATDLRVTIHRLSKYRTSFYRGLEASSG